MKWVTWERIGVDRMACAWFILRFIDPKASIVFVPRDQTTLPKSTEAFDIPGAKFSHHKGHCSFHALQQEYQPKDAILARISRIVDEADTVQEVNLEPAAAGLDLLCRGIRLTSASDEEALERGLMIYDALYAQLQADAKK